MFIFKKGLHKVITISSVRKHTLRFHSHSSQKIERVVGKLVDILGSGNVASSDAVREQHGKDESHHQVAPPDVVLFPQSVEQVSSVAKICYEARIPMVPFGTGTGMEGGIHCVNGGVCVDLTKMNQVTEYHPEDFSITVQPGVTRLALNEYIKGDGLWFPIDPGADASLCGMASTSASGTNAVRYGTMRENVSNLEVVLADGRIIHTAGQGRRTKKTSAGYNLTNLFVGSEGTLGFITSTTLRLYGIPDTITSAVCHFPSIADAVQSVQDVLNCGVPIARMELLDELQMMATNRYNKLHLDEKPSLFLEFHGSSTETQEQAQLVAEICSNHNGAKFQWASDLAERNRLWKARHSSLYSIMALRPGTKQISTDVCVPISRLTEIINSTKDDLTKNKIFGAVLGHVGDGNFHVALLYDPDDINEKEAVLSFCDRLVGKALEMDGTCTGEHGVGIGKIKYLEPELGRDTVQVMKQIKQALDPYGLMNPGKVISS